VREVEFHWQSLPASIRDFDQSGSIAFRGVAQLQYIQIRRKFGQAAGITRREIYIRYDLIRRKPRVNREVNLGLNALVRAGISKNRSLDYIRAFD
jgi:hypothetical protein